MSLRVLENVELVGSQLNAKLGIFFLVVLNKDGLVLRYSQRVASRPHCSMFQARALPSEGRDKPSISIHVPMHVCM